MIGAFQGCTGTLGPCSTRPAHCPGCAAPETNWQPSPHRPKGIHCALYRVGCKLPRHRLEHVLHALLLLFVVVVVPLIIAV